jgi:diguanylate cyclase (GGDEF)-like protein/PAS domain S-box-containing protein
MNMSRAGIHPKQLLAVIGIAIFLTFLFVQSRKVDLVTHSRALYAIKEIEMLDLQIDEMVVKLRSSRHHNYDEFVNAGNALEHLLQELKGGQYAIYRQGDERVDGLLRKLEQAVAHKEDLLEEFKSDNAVLKNSIYYLPIAADLTIRLDPSGKTLKTYLDNLVRDVLLMQSSGNSEIVDKEIRQLQGILAGLGGSNSNLHTQLQYTLKHADYTVDLGRDVNEETVRITDGANRRLMDELTDAYEESFNRAYRTANLYRFILFLASLWLLAYVFYTFFRLQVNASKLQSAELESRKAEKREHSRNKVLELLARKDIPLPEILHSVVSDVEAEKPYMTCSIMLPDDSKTHLINFPSPGLPVRYRAAMNGIAIEGDDACPCIAAMQSGKRQIVGNIAEAGKARNCTLATRAGIAACWAEPIKAAAGNTIGIFAAYFHTPRSPDADEIHLIENTANLISVAIERKRLDEELQLAAQVYQNSSEGIMIADADMRILGVNPAFTQITGYSPDDVVAKNINFFTSFQNDKTLDREIFRSLKSDGSWQGEVWDKHKNGEAQAKWLTINTIKNADGTVHRYLALFSDITEKKRSEELVWRQANFDMLTGLPNRRMFRDRLEQEIIKSQRSGVQFALFLIDLDQFKEVNDTLGHHVGDLLLGETARRIVACVRESDTVSRLGGDEFAVILTQVPDGGHVERIAQNIITKLNDPFCLGEETVYISASVGITLYPSDAPDVDQLLKNADQSMYEAKNRGRNRFSYFTPSLQIAAQKRLHLANDLRTALVAGELRVNFQPIVNLATGNIYKMEALVQWHHPQKGLIHPAEFIPLAEETGLIIQIGDWVFMESVRWLERWKSLCGEDVQVSLNVSPVQFKAKGDLQEKSWINHLASCGLGGKNLVIEITEGLLLNAEADIMDKLLKFRDAGIQVAIDDFGTGYSSLAYIKKFDVDYLKIDRSFVHNLEDSSSDVALCEAIIVMAHKLDIKVIAEGVETLVQQRLLSGMGCDYAQGYLYSRPVAPDELALMVTSANPVTIH